MNLLEKQLSTVYFKDVRFPWVNLYFDWTATNEIRGKLMNEELYNTDHVFKTKGEKILQQNSPCRVTIAVLINKFPLIFL